MKPILKLLFVALLIGWVLSRPSPARADGKTFSCNGEFGTCSSQAQQWMSSCMTDCTDTGSGGTYVQVCDGLSCRFLGEGDGQDGAVVYSEGCSYGGCFSAPSGAASCVQSCVDEMDNLMNQCLANYCTQD
jgi:hypothetical protein